MHNALDFIHQLSNFWLMSGISDHHLIYENFVIENNLVDGNRINFVYDGLEYTGVIDCSAGGPYLDFIELI